MENLITNIALAKQASLNGRAHFVATMTLIVPGVLDGSSGPLYYPAEEIAKDPSVWNHIPILVQHPSINVSARCAKILNEQAIGLILNARIHNKKLVADGWIDIERVGCIDSRVLSALTHNRAIELSTGLMTTKEQAPAGATFNNVPYDAIAKNLKPDHLAILPDSIGACSIRDGCGVLANSSGDRSNGLPPFPELFESREKQVDPRESLRLPTYADYINEKPATRKPPSPTPRKSNDRGPGLPMPDMDY